MPSHNTKPFLSNLPAALSTFIGREREISEVRQLLSANRLITLTGAGGSGKTRLALKVSQELVEDFEQGIWFVELASIFDAAFLPQAIATTLNIQERSTRSIMDSVVDYLSGRQALLVVDNCEHLVAACADITDLLLQKCSGLKILATSREVLGITGEVTWSVPPLSLPAQQPWVNPASAVDALVLYQESESVQLFVARAKSKSPGFKLTVQNGVWVAEICRRLDGMPLAIELAAARVRSLSVQQIAQRLDDRFHLLTGGSRTAPLRQRTLVATLDWSYALLPAKEQKVLQLFSVFAGGATLEAAEAVCASSHLPALILQPSEVLGALSQLIDKSLVIASKPERGGTRYHLLETVRQYALGKLAQVGEVNETRDRHLDYFIQWAEIAEPHLDRTEQIEWLEFYEAEHDNLRAALEWCNEHVDRAGAGLRLAAACGRFWRLRGYLSEGQMHLSAALSKPGMEVPSITRARALSFLANIIYLQSDYPAMHPLAEEALSIWRELGEPGRSGAAFTLDLLGELATEEGDYDCATVFFQEAMDIYTELNDVRGTGLIHAQFGWAAMRTGDYEGAESHLNQFLSLARQAGVKPSLAFAYSGLGEVALRQGQFERAISLLKQALALNRERGDIWSTATQLGSLGWVALCQLDYKKMRAYLDESLSIRREINDKGGIAWCLEKLAEAKAEQGQYQDAARIFAHAESMRTPVGSVIDPADQPDHNRIIVALQSALGMHAFNALWAQGKDLPLEEIIDLALSEAAASSTPSAKERFGGLTPREREVASWIAQGKSNREIAEAMTVGVKTVETYVTRILNKLHLTSRVQIATWAIEVDLHN